MKRYMLIFSILSLGLTLNLSASMPYGHILFADLWHQATDSDSDYDEVIIGTLYPDIRYIAGLDRDETHEIGISLEDVETAESSFEQGRLLHCWVDEVRDSFVEEEGLYDDLEGLPMAHRSTFIKLLEDEIYYDQWNWSEARRCILGMMPQELTAELEADKVSEWYQLVRLYLSQRPSKLMHRMASSGKSYRGITHDVFALWMVRLPKLAKDPKAREAAQRLREHMEEQIANHLNAK